MARELSRQAKMQMLIDHYPKSKPLHREKCRVHASDGTSTFSAGRFLSTLGDIVQRGDDLDEELLDKMMKLPWFAAWYGTQRARAVMAPNALPAKPTMNEQVELLVGAYSYEQPVRGKVIVVERADGRTFTLNGALVLDKIASAMHGGVCAGKYRISETACADLARLPWVKDWLERSADRRSVGAMRKVVTKDMKLELVLHHCRKYRPGWDDAPIPVHVPGSDTFYFRPATWIDDLADNWLCDKRPSVTLTEDQMMALESLPWLAAWLQGVLRRRK